MILRILASVILLISVLFWPFWVSVILAFLGIIYFNIYWEAVLLFFLSDLLFGMKEAKLSGMLFVSFFGALAVLLITEFVKRKMKFYP